MFKPSTWAQPVQDIVKEYNTYEKESLGSDEVPTEPEALSRSMVRRGVIDPETGLLTGNSKQGCITNQNIKGFSTRGKMNYEKIFGHP